MVARARRKTEDEFGIPAFLRVDAKERARRAADWDRNHLVPLQARQSD